MNKAGILKRRSLSAKDRPIGGLGILIVKKTMDKVEYERKDGKYIFRVWKKLH